MKQLFFLFAVSLIFSTCAPVQYNQYRIDGKVQKRDGRWKELSSSEVGEFTAKGRYRKGEKIGVWKTSLAGQPFQREVYKGNIIKTKFYYPNGRLKEKGNSKVEITDKFRHWFYDGIWQYFSEDGKLIDIKNYQKGQKVDRISF